MFASLSSSVLLFGSLNIESMKISEVLLHIKLAPSSGSPSQLWCSLTVISLLPNDLRFGRVWLVRYCLFFVF